MSRVLFVDDEPIVLNALVRWFTRQGFEAIPAGGLQDALRRLEESVATGARFDAVCTDLSMPDGNGLEVLRAVRRLVPGTPVVIFSAYASVSTAVEAMRLGAVTLLEKPAEMPYLEQQIRAAIGDSHQVDDGVSAAGAAGLVGEAPVLRQLLGTLVRVAPSTSTVLLTGESGTGKELVAQAIHRLGRRAQGPLVAVNCAALPEALLESELFGHERGAFTGATNSRPGRFRAAHGGTLFLDEIGELPLGLQAKLLRVLQDHAVLPVGGERAHPVDFRLVAATNRDLQEMVDRGLFRADLYYRLNVVPLTLPPLRERDGDVPILIRHFLARGGRRMRLAPDAMAALEAWRWPGNVRELENLVERLGVLFGEDEVRREDLPEPYRGAAAGTPVAPRPAVSSASQPAAARSPVTPPAAGPAALPREGVDLRAVLAELEERLIKEALELSGGNKNQAARYLGLNRTTLVEKLRKRARIAGAADRAADASGPSAPEDEDGAA